MVRVSHTEEVESNRKAWILYFEFYIAISLAITYSVVNYVYLYVIRLRNCVEGIYSYVVVIGLRYLVMLIMNKSFPPGIREQKKDGNLRG